MSKIDDFIKNLPSELQDVAGLWVNALLDKGEEYVTAWLKEFYTGSKRKAFSNLAESLSTKDLLRELDSLNSRLKAINNKNAEYYELQNGLLDIVVSVLIKFLVDSVSEN